MPTLTDRHSLLKNYSERFFQKLEKPRTLGRGYHVGMTATSSNFLRDLEFVSQY